MSNMEDIFKESRNVEDFAKGYVRYLSALLSKLDTGAIAAFIRELEKTRQDQRTIFIIGNGGSAATAMHMANDIGVDVYKKSGTDIPFRVLALCENVSVATAIANDSGYENLFLNQLHIHYRPGDLLVAISASGNSPNVVSAAEWVRAGGGRVLGMLGFDGGRLKNLCDVFILVETPKGEFGPVEDIHLVLDHLMSHWLQFHLKKP
jgi:D-sedoheptulose 7-phosphate isomerase